MSSNGKTEGGIVTDAYALEAAERILNCLHPLDINVDDAHAVAQAFLALKADKQAVKSHYCLECNRAWKGERMTCPDGSAHCPFFPPPPQPRGEE